MPDFSQTAPCEISLVCLSVCLFVCLSVCPLEIAHFHCYRYSHCLCISCDNRMWILCFYYLFSIVIFFQYLFGIVWQFCVFIVIIVGILLVLEIFNQALRILKFWLLFGYFWEVWNFCLTFLFIHSYKTCRKGPMKLSLSVCQYVKMSVKSFSQKLLIRFFWNFTFCKGEIWQSLFF